MRVAVPESTDIALDLLIQVDPPLMLRQEFLLCKLLPTGVTDVLERIDVSVLNVPQHLGPVVAGPKVAVPTLVVDDFTALLVQLLFTIHHRDELLLLFLLPGLLLLSTFSNCLRHLRKDTRYVCYSLFVSFVLLQSI